MSEPRTPPASRGGSRAPLLCVPIAHAAGGATKNLQLEVSINGQKTNLIAAFKHVLDRARIPATVRLTRGRDIAAACGQLAATRA